MVINEKTQIYVACPPNSATGGPELLHQLVYKLNKKGLNSHIFYYPPDIYKNPIHPNYKRYIDKYVKRIDDNKDNILIVPETRTFILKEYKHIQKIIWWQSVDNYLNRIKGEKNLIRRFLRINSFFNIYNKREHKIIDLHLVQSKYAEMFLKKYNITNIKYLSDYIRQDFIDRTKNLDLNNKINWVLYNPKKGFDFTQKLIEKYKDIEWKAIINLTPDEVTELIAKSKVYIDFGNHPGKDRLPRECALLRCCVITNKTGSAFYIEDVPIKNDYKFDTSTEKIENIYKKIKSCLINFDSELKNFEEYREIIKNQEEIFDVEIDQLFFVNK